MINAFKKDENKDLFLIIVRYYKNGKLIRNCLYDEFIYYRVMDKNTWYDEIIDYLEYKEKKLNEITDDKYTIKLIDIFKDC